MLLRSQQVHGRRRSPSRQVAGDLGPLVANKPLPVHDVTVLLVTPQSLAHIRVEEVVPSLMTLLPIAVREVRRYLAPVSCSVFLDQQPIKASRKTALRLSHNDPANSPLAMAIVHLTMLCLHAFKVPQLTSEPHPRRLSTDASC